MTERLHGRTVEFEVGQPGAPGLAITGLPIIFDVQFKLDGKPNQGSFGIRGASRDLYSRCAEKNSVIRLLAGYSIPKLIFTGNPIPRVGVSFRHDQGARLLEIQALDAGNKYSSSYLDLSVAGTTNVKNLLQKAANQLDATLGPLPPGLGRITVPAGFYSSGKASVVLDELAEMGDFSATLQDDSLLIIPDDGDTGEEAVVLSTKTRNLLQLEQKKDGTVKFKALLDGSVRPGRRVVFEHPDFSGAAKIRDVRFYGDPGWDVPYYTEGTARPTG